MEHLTDHITKWVGSSTSIVLHTVLFVLVFGLLVFGVALDTILLILTTVVSLEAIYLALFIQRTVNMNTATLAEAAEDIEDLGEDLEEVERGLSEIEEDIDQISEDVDEISEDIEELDKDKVEPDSPSIISLQKDVAELKSMLKAISKQLEK